MVILRGIQRQMDLTPWINKLLMISYVVVVSIINGFFDSVNYK